MCFILKKVIQKFIQKVIDWKVIVIEASLSASMVTIQRHFGLPQLGLPIYYNLGKFGYYFEVVGF